MPRFLLIVALISLGFAPRLDATTPRGWVNQRYAPGPPDNPLKGLVPFRGGYDAFPYSMEWDYIPWNTIQTDVDSFNWAPLEQVLDEAASRRHQVAFRIYADYPNTPSALPAFLSGVARHAYTDSSNGQEATSYSPDYDDPLLRRAMLNLIRALGARYDGDPRIGFITVGLLGFWGEWHTYRPSCGCDEWMPSKGMQRAVLEAYDKAFHRTRLLARYPDVGWKKDRMGFHDDSFAYQTIGRPSWMFLTRMKKVGATRQWRHEPIGGELWPADQPCAFQVPACSPVGQDFASSVDATHASWIIDHYAFQTGYTDADYDRAVAGARRLGYDLFVSGVKLADTTTRDSLEVEIRVQNRGVAPFYYDWLVRLGIIDSDSRLAASFNTSWKLTRVVDAGQDVKFGRKVKAHGLGPGVYTLVMQAENPMPTGRTLAFANADWEADAKDWLTLGTFEVGVR